MTESKIQIGMSQEFLDTTTVTTSAGLVHREAVFNADPTNPNARQAVDESNKAAVVMEAEHYRIHQGEGYTASGKSSVAEGGGEKFFLIDNTNGAYPHFREFSVVAGEAPMDMYVYESPTTSANGTAIPARNNNRNSSNVAVLDIYDGPTVSANGTQLEYFLIAGTKQSGGSGGNVPVEWILKPATKYLIRVINNVAGAGSTDIGIHMFWYESAT